MTKPCKDCKWAAQEGWIRKKWRCTRPYEIPEHDVRRTVYGQTTTLPNWLCEDERRSSGPYDCGPSGRFWEKRIASPEFLAEYNAELAARRQAAE